jgi:hypothetical protein
MFGTHRAPNLHRHKHCLQTYWNEISHDPRHVRVPSGASKTISKPMVRSTQTVYLSCIKISTIFKTDRIELLVEPHHLGVPLGASKTIPVLMVRFAQTVDLSCTNTNTISKWTKTRFHMTHAPRSSIGCVQNGFWAYGTFGANHAPILCQD